MAGQSVQNQRQLRIAEQIRHILSAEIRECQLSDPALDGLNTLTVSEVRISPDLKNATAYVTKLGGGSFEGKDGFMKALNGASAYFRKCLAQEMDLRYTPRLNFVYDKSFAEASQIDALLSSDKVRRDTQK
ncbi:MAG: 30S ribosome-binding factor RbfA [Micavibrio sp.]|nr:MAG: 30S ribosome-binding factor RbfA [Micavibrio sp.]